MNSDRRQFLKLGMLGTGMIIGSGMFHMGTSMDQDGLAYALDQTIPSKTAPRAQAASSIDPRPLFAFVKAMGAFDNAPKGDKAQLQARHRDLQHLAPGFITTSKTVVQELKAKGHWATTDRFLYAEAAKDRLPSQLIAEVRSVGGPSVVLENIDRFITEDLKNRLQRIATSNQGSIFAALGFVGTAHAGTACSIGAWGANGIMKVFGLLTKKDYSSDIEAANLRYCM